MNELVPATPQPAPTTAEHLTRQFYNWELRGRGWIGWDEPVALEPPFIPLNYTLPDRVPKDDGRQATFFSRLADWMRGVPEGRALPPAQLEEVPLLADLHEVTPQWVEYSRYGELALLVPENFPVSTSLTRHLLLNLAALQAPVSFEIVGTAETVNYQFATPESQIPAMRQQIEAVFPEAELRPTRENLYVRWQAREQPHFQVVDFGLSEEFVRPLRTPQSLDIDPLLPTLAVLNDLAEGEIGAIQVLFAPCVHPWAESALRAVSDGKGGSFFVDAPEMVSLARKKVSQPLFAVVLRVAVSAASSNRIWEIIHGIAGSFAHFIDPVSNQLIPLSNDEFDLDERLEELFLRCSCRCGMILNADELLGLVHPPAPSVRCQRLARLSGQTKAAPDFAQGGTVLLGVNEHNGIETEVRLSDDARVRHLYAIGASGTGKSTLLLNLICQDMENGAGLALLDPHGDLLDDVLLRIPEHRKEDVIVFDPADAEYPIGFNILAAHSDLEKTLLSSDLVAVFQRLATSWGDQMTTVLANAILAFLESSRDGTLADLRRFLVEKPYRDEFLRTVQDPAVVYYWQREFPLLVGKPQGPILTRLDFLLRPKLVRNIVAQPANRLDFSAIMNEGKILLVRLSHGAIGEENAHLLGSMLVSKLQQTAMARQAVAARERRPFFLYLDEFHHFVTPSMSAILTGARKYGLGLVLAHQELRQLEKRDPEVAHAVLANPYARVAFRVSEHDAKRLGEGLSTFDSTDLLNLGTGEAIVRLEQARHDFNMTTLPAAAPPPDATWRKEQAIARSRLRYGTPRADVEKALQASIALPPAKEKRPKKGLETPPPAEPQEAIAMPPEAVPVAKSEQPVQADKPKPASEPVKPAPSQASPASTTMGKGGQRHRYLQQFFKRLAEGMGYRATIEKQLPSGGSVDLVLEKADYSLACEIGVTTTLDHELQNLRKCLNAEFAEVAALVESRSKLRKLENLAEAAFTEDQLQRLAFYLPDELIAHLEQREARSASVQTEHAGYRVNVNYKSVANTERETKRSAVAKVVLKALRRRI